MGRGAILAVLCVLGVLALSCSAKSRCRQICTREAVCSEQKDAPLFDQTECVELCAELERDPSGRDMVERHEQCVNRSTDCRDVLACR